MQQTFRHQKDTLQIQHIAVDVLKLEEKPSQFIRTAIREFALNHGIEVKKDE